MTCWQHTNLVGRPVTIKTTYDFKGDDEDVQPAGLSATIDADADDGEDVELPETLISSDADIDGEDCDACTI